MTDNDHLPEMYGTDKVDPKKLTEATKEFTVKTDGKNFVKLNTERGKEVIVPQAVYVKELEQQIDSLKSKVKSVEADNRILTVAVKRLQHEMVELRAALKKKVDRH